MKRFLYVTLFLGILMLLGACVGGNDATPTASVNTEAQTGDMTNRPSAPATDDYRPDPASWVANSGYPQLVEVFSYD